MTLSSTEQELPNVTVQQFLPVADQTPPGSAAETMPGQFKSTDTDAPNHSQHFYRFRSP
jgi:hypothetical protein